MPGIDSRVCEVSQEKCENNFFVLGTRDTLVSLSSVKGQGNFCWRIRSYWDRCDRILQAEANAREFAYVTANNTLQCFGRLGRREISHNGRATSFRMARLYVESVVNARLHNVDTIA